MKKYELFGFLNKNVQFNVLEYQMFFVCQKIHEWLLFLNSEY